jgi:hypothetical protein
MKKIIFSIACLLAFNFLFSQNNLVVFSEQGERFYLILNGVKQNAKAETNVKVTELTQPYYTAKIIFDGASLPELDQKIYLMQEGNNVNGFEFVYAVISNKKGEYKVRYRSAVPVAQAQPQQANQTVVVYSSTPPANVITETTTISTTTTTGVAPAGENINVGMNMGGVGFNMNVNINDGMMNSNTTSMSTTTVTSSSTTVSSAGTSMPVAYVPGYNGPYGCPVPMSNADFSNAKNTISSKSFEDSKLQIAKQVTSSNCLLSAQVKEIMLLFDFEQSRLNYAKYAYGYTYDKGNYFNVNDAFDFETSIQELNNHIGNR